MRAGIDFGISFTDLVLAADDAPDKPALYHFPSDKPVSPERMRELLQKVHHSPASLESIAVAGGHSAVLPDQVDGTPIHRINEIDALAASAPVLLGDKYRPPLLLINAGSGTTCVLVSEDGNQHIGGNATGGGTLVGLARLLLGTVDAEEIDALAKAGRATAVDLSLGDVVSSPIGKLPPDATAVNFGQLIHHPNKISREDLAAGLTNLIGQSVALTSLSSALAAGVNNVCVVGRTPRLAGVRHAMERVFALAMGGSLQICFPELGASACALGALAQSRNTRSAEKNGGASRV